MLRYIPAALVLFGSLKAISADVPPWFGELLIEPALTTDKCLNAASNNDGAEVTIQTCRGSANQKWSFIGDSIKIFGDKCLTVPGGSHNDGTTVQIDTCQSGNPSQQWNYNKWVNMIVWQGRCLDLTGGNTNDGNKPALFNCYGGPNQIWNVGYLPNEIPEKTAQGQSGRSACGTSSSQQSNCQTAWINSLQDFCLFGPPNPNSEVGNTETEQVVWCTKDGHGTRIIPPGTLKGVHFLKTKDYVQITGEGDFTKMNIRRGDAGGELDDRGSTGTGNPPGGLVYGNVFGRTVQFHEWTTFMSDKQFCFRACIGGDAQKNCMHIYDEMGCDWNMPANYAPGVFETCDADNDLPMGVYGTSTWHQGTSPTPSAHPVASSSNCVAAPTVTSDSHMYKRMHHNHRRSPASPHPTPTA